MGLGLGLGLGLGSVIEHQQHQTGSHAGVVQIWVVL